MKLLNRVTENPAGRMRGGGGPVPCRAGVCALFAASAFACSDREPFPSRSAGAQAGTGDAVAQTGGTGGNEAGAGGTGQGGSGARPSSEAEQPNLDLNGAAGALAADAGGAATVGDAGGAEEIPGGGDGLEDGWVPLFNGVNLDGWVAHGTTEPLFAAENGEIHVYPTQADQSDQPQANLRSTTLLSDRYTLHVEYRWGEARFSDRRQTERDAGILFHVTGDVTRVWPDSIECQLGSSPINGDTAANRPANWVTGDLWVLGNPTFAQTRNANGQLQTHGGGYGFTAASVQAENPHGEWNVVDIIVDGASEAIYMVNGVEVNRVFNMTYDGQPLREGFVSVQAEYAELFYRDIRYRLNE
jgi:hypothetical protein